MRWTKFFVVLVLVSSPYCFGQSAPGTATKRPVAQSPGFSITLAPPAGPVRLGSPILITVTVTNITTGDFYWASERGQNGAYKEFRFLLTKDGHEVETTVFHRRITGRQRPDDPQEVENGSTILLSHPPGVMFMFKVDIARLYDIKEAGEYALDVSRFDEYSKTMVRSETLTLKIVP